MDPDFIAFLLTAAGATVASGIIWAAIDFLKMSPLNFLVDGRERLAAFVGSGLVVLFAIIVGLLEVPPRYPIASALDIVMLFVSALIAFYGIGRLAMGIHDDVNKRVNSLTGKTQ